MASVSLEEHLTPSRGTGLTIRPCDSTEDVLSADWVKATRLSSRQGPYAKLDDPNLRILCCLACRAAHEANCPCCGSENGLEGGESEHLSLHEPETLCSSQALMTATRFQTL